MPSVPHPAPEEYCGDDVTARLDALEVRLADAERRIAEALAPEPVDWQAHYERVLTEAAEAGRRLYGAMSEGGD